MAKRRELDPRFRQMYQVQEDTSHHERNRKRDFLQEARGSTNFVISRIANHIESQLENPEADIGHLQEKMLNTNDKKLFDLWLSSNGDSKTRQFLETIANVKLRNNPNSVALAFIDQERFNTDPTGFLEDAFEDPERNPASLKRYMNQLDSGQLLNLWKYSAEFPGPRQMIEQVASELAEKGKHRLQRLIQEYKKKQG